MYNAEWNTIEKYRDGVNVLHLWIVVFIIYFLWVVESIHVDIQYVIYPAVELREQKSKQLLVSQQKKVDNWLSAVFVIIYINS